MLAATSAGNANGHAAPPPPAVPAHQPHLYHQPPPMQPPPPSFMPPTSALTLPPVPVAHPAMYPTMQHQQPPPSQPMLVPPQQSYYRPPPPPAQPAAASQPLPAPAADINIDSGQRVRFAYRPLYADRSELTCMYFVQAMLMQVLSLTPDQINSLPPTERDAIQQLVGASLFSPLIPN